MVSEISEMLRYFGELGRGASVVTTVSRCDIPLILRTIPFERTPPARWPASCDAMHVREPIVARVAEGNEP